MCCGSVENQIVLFMFDIVEVGKRIKKFRSKAMLKQSELADICGVGLTTIQRWEQGKNAMSLDMLDVICQALNVDPNYLMYGTKSTLKPETISSIIDKFLDAIENESMSHESKVKVFTLALSETLANED